MALKVLATGGVYLGGGISPRILPFLESGEFIRAFNDKGRFSSLLASIPVQVILNPKVGLIGAAAYGFDL
jgi:glucokinase